MASVMSRLTDASYAGFERPWSNTCRQPKHFSWPTTSDLMYSVTGDLCMSRSSFTADDLPVPRPVAETIRPAPAGNALSRGIRALLQGRLPESARAKLDAAL